MEESDYLSPFLGLWWIQKRSQQDDLPYRVLKTPTLCETSVKLIAVCYVEAEDVTCCLTLMIV